MEEIEKWIEAKPPHTFGYYCGLEPVNFPPSKQLCKKDQKGYGIYLQGFQADDVLMGM